MYSKKKIDDYKRSFSVFFLLIFTVLVFKFLFFTSFIKSHKKDFRKQLIEQNSANVFSLKIPLDYLFIDKTGFDWKEKGKELVINGVYHEVVRIKKCGDHVLVFLIEDSQENELFNKYFCLNKNMRNEYSDLMKLLLDFGYIDQKISYNVQMYFVNSKNICLDVIFNKSDFLHKIIKPPRVQQT